MAVPRCRWRARADGRSLSTWDDESSCSSWVASRWAPGVGRPRRGWPRAARAASAQSRSTCHNLNPRGVDQRVAAVVGGGVPAFATTWKSRLFEYCFLRAASGTYVDFARPLIVRDGLTHAAKKHAVTLSDAQRARLETAFTELTPWPDSVAALERMKAQGMRLAPLANYAPSMIDALFAHAGIGHLFEARDPARTRRARTSRSARLRARGDDVRSVARANRICRVRWLGRGRREVVRAAHVLGEPPRGRAGGARAARRHGTRPQSPRVVARDDGWRGDTAMTTRTQWALVPLRVLLGLAGSRRTVGRSCRVVRSTSRQSSARSDFPRRYRSHGRRHSSSSAAASRSWPARG